MRRGVCKHILEDGHYAAEKVIEGAMPSSRLEGFSLDTAALFAALESLPR